MTARNLLPLSWAVLLWVGFSPTAWGGIIAFGSGGNAFQMEFVTIGSPGNADDTTGFPSPAGAVGYTYQLGKFEVSRDMVTKANAAGSLGITLADLTSFGGNGPNKPASGVSWNEAARFVNWLNTSQGFSPAYKFALQTGDPGYDFNANIQLWAPGDSGYDAANLYRNSLARYVLPTMNEWYKGAYYDPGANGGAGSYWDFPTGSDALPTQVGSGTAAGTAVFRPANGPAEVTLAGGLSPFGTMGQGGNVNDWLETANDLMNSSATESRGFRGGGWADAVSPLRSTSRLAGGPTFEFSTIGFRVAAVNLDSPTPAVPEPGTLALLGMAGATLAVARLLRRKAIA